MCTNNNLNKARKIKNDEYYTLMEDIEKELEHYDFTNKIVYCKTDTEDSNFVKYFKTRTEIKELIYSSYDFRSDEAIENLKRCDVVVTNPPFSLIKEYIPMLFEYKKDFLIVAPMQSFTYSYIFPYFKDNIINVGYNQIKNFNTKDGIKSLANVYWMTTLKVDDKPFFYSGTKFNDRKYEKYSNYDAIEIKRLKDLPDDYNEVMGVTPTILLKYNRKQFELIGVRQGLFYIHGKCVFLRILLKRVKLNATKHS